MDAFSSSILGGDVVERAVPEKVAGDRWLFFVDMIHSVAERQSESL